MDRQCAENVLVSVSEDVLTKTWQLELQAEAAEVTQHSGASRGGRKEEEGQPAPDRTDNQLVRPKEGWDIYKGRRIWVKNEIGQDLLVYVDKFGTIGELINIGGGAGAGATAANIEAHLELQRKAARVQIDRLGAGGGNVVFDLGRRDSAAYVTAALADNKGMFGLQGQECSHGLLSRIESNTISGPSAGTSGRSDNRSSRPTVVCIIIMRTHACW